MIQIKKSFDGKLFDECYARVWIIIQVDIVVFRFLNKIDN